MQDAQARRRRGGGEQHRLEVDLIAAMRRFRRRPPRVRAVFRRIALGAAGNLDAADFEAGGRGANGHIVGIVGRQPGLAHGARDPEPAERLHGPGADDIGASDRRLARGAHFGDRHRDAPLREIDRQRQPDWARADDKHIGVAFAATSRPPKTRAFRSRPERSRRAREGGCRSARWRSIR